MNVITVSRSYGSGGTLFARRLSEALGYQYADEAFIAKINETEHVRHALAVNAEDESAPIFSEKIAELADNSNFFKANLERSVLGLALKGNLVFVGTEPSQSLQCSSSSSLWTGIL